MTTLTRKTIQQLVHRGRPYTASAVQLWLLEDMEDVEQARTLFWRCVQQYELVLLEFLNDAILGLVYCQGRPGILYEAAAAQKLSQANWSLSPAADEATVLDVATANAQRWSDVLHGDYGARSPWWAVP